jgi:hypothetical protein
MLIIIKLLIIKIRELSGGNDMSNFQFQFYYTKEITYYHPIYKEEKPAYMIYLGEFNPEQVDKLKKVFDKSSFELITSKAVHDHLFNVEVMFKKTMDFELSYVLYLLYNLLARSI